MKKVASVTFFYTFYLLQFILITLINHTHTQKEVIMSSAYTLRAGLLTQAEGILNHQYHHEYERLRYLCDRDLVDPKTVTWPEPPKTDAILAEAEKLYKFVQTK